MKNPVCFAAAALALPSAALAQENCQSFDTGRYPLGHVLSEQQQRQLLASGPDEAARDTIHCSRDGKSCSVMDGDGVVYSWRDDGLILGKAFAPSEPSRLPGWQGGIGRELAAALSMATCVRFRVETDDSGLSESDAYLKSETQKTGGGRDYVTTIFGAGAEDDPLTIEMSLTFPTDAEQPSSRALFDVIDVNRDTVPPGTPEAFWTVFGPSPRNEAMREVDGQHIIYVPLALIPLPDGNVALVSTGANDCVGDACSGLNSIHYLRRENARYEVDGEWIDVGASGAFGNPAMRWGWTDAIADAPVLYTEGGGVWQGYACFHAALTELTEAGPVEIASIPIHYSDGGAVDTGDIALSGEIAAAEKGRSFTVGYTGSRTFSEHYVRDEEGRYRVAGGTQVPAC